MMTNQANTMREIEKLYRVMDEVFAEYTRLNDQYKQGKLDELGYGRLSAYEHLINLYTK